MLHFPFPMPAAQHPPAAPRSSRVGTGADPGDPRRSAWGRNRCWQTYLGIFNGLVEGKILTGNHGFYHQINRGFRLKCSHHPIL